MIIVFLLMSERNDSGEGLCWASTEPLRDNSEHLHRSLLDDDPASKGGRLYCPV